MNLEKFHLVRAHERIRDAADALQGALVSLGHEKWRNADGYYEDATALLESAMEELGGRIVWNAKAELKARLAAIDAWEPLDSDEPRP